MSKKRKTSIAEQIYAELVGGGVDFAFVTELQKRPYTVVEIEYTNPETGATMSGVGFSKVCWPDEWDADRGSYIATIKACADLAKRLSLSGENPFA